MILKKNNLPKPLRLWIVLIFLILGCAGLPQSDKPRKSPNPIQKPVGENTWVRVDRMDLAVERGRPGYSLEIEWKRDIEKVHLVGDDIEFTEWDSRKKGRDRLFLPWKLSRSSQWFWEEKESEQEVQLVEAKPVISEENSLVLRIKIPPEAKVSLQLKFYRDWSP